MAIVPFFGTLVSTVVPALFVLNTLGNVPSSHLANHLFHQDGEHVNLFDWPLLRWALVEAAWRAGALAVLTLFAGVFG